MTPAMWRHVMLSFLFLRCLTASEHSSLRSEAVSDDDRLLVEELPSKHRHHLKKKPSTETPRVPALRTLGDADKASGDISVQPYIRIPQKEPESKVTFSVNKSHKKVKDEPKKRNQAPLFDKFWFVYWGSVVGVSLTAFLIMTNIPGRSTQAYFGEQQYSDEMSHEVESDGEAGGKHSMGLRRTTSMLSEMLAPRTRTGDVDEDKLDLPENMWALVACAAMGKAKIKSSGRPLSVWPPALTAFVMGTVQLLGLFLMIHDLDPHAEPVTTDPSTPYGSVETVNSMKIVMGVIMVVALVGEAGQCQSILHTTLCMYQDHLQVPKWVPIGYAVFQYVIAILVVWSGIAVILSFQSVPDIVYSSMSIMCISNVDEMFFEAFKTLFGLDVQFDNIDRESDDCDFPLWYYFITKLLLLFPILLGVQIFIRAWDTGVMPTERFRELFDMMHI